MTTKFRNNRISQNNIKRFGQDFTKKDDVSTTDKVMTENGEYLEVGDLGVGVTTTEIVVDNTVAEIPVVDSILDIVDIDVGTIISSPITLKMGETFGGTEILNDTFDTEGDIVTYDLNYSLEGVDSIKVEVVGGTLTIKTITRGL